MVNYRPYKNAEEFLQAWKEHGPFFKIKNRDIYYSVSSFDDKMVFYSDWAAQKIDFSGDDYEDFLETAVWSDGTPCGIIKNDESCLEIINKALDQINCSNALYTIEDVRFLKPLEDTPCYLISSDGNVNLGCFEDGQFKAAHFTSGEGHEGDVKWRQRIYYTPTTDVTAYIPYGIQ